jgi:glutathionyl-hydroquinone reductase
MDNVTFFDIVNPITQDTETHAIIDHGNGEFTSMLKSTYDEQQEAIANFVPLTLPEAPTE